MPRVNSKSIVSVLGTVTYNGNEIVNIFNLPIEIDLSNKLLSSIEYYSEYIVQYTDRWDVISNKFYGSPHYWWVIFSYNKMKDPFADLIVGNTIKIIKAEYLPSLLLALKEQATRNNNNSNRIINYEN